MRECTNNHDVGEMFLGSLWRRWGKKEKNRNIICTKQWDLNPGALYQEADNVLMSQENPFGKIESENLLWTYVILNLSSKKS